MEQFYLLQHVLSTGAITVEVVVATPLWRTRVKHYELIFYLKSDYSLIAFDERVTFWLQRVRSLPCACAYVALFARTHAYNHYAIAHAYNAANAHAQGSDRAR